MVSWNGYRPLPILSTGRLIEALQKVYQLGTSCRSDKARNIRIKLEEQQAPAEVQTQIQQMSAGHPGMKEALWAAFYLGIRQHFLLRPNEYLLCRVNHLLAEAFLCLPSSLTREIVNASRHLGMDAETWVRCCNGVLALARVASALAESGTVFLPKIEEDVRDKIDLLFLLPSGSSGLCVQVKSSVSDDVTRAVIVDCAAVAHHDDVPYLRFTEGIQRFRRGNHAAWLPAIVSVGQRALVDSVNVHECPAVQEAVSQLIAAARGNDAVGRSVSGLLPA